MGRGETDDMRAEEQECGESAEIVWRQLSLPLKFAFTGYKGTTEGNFPVICWWGAGEKSYLHRNQWQTSIDCKGA